MPKPSGSAGWDEYAEFYDWENAQTMARRDVAFWRRLALGANGRVLELGCGTGRVTVPLARAGAPIVGVDLSAPMLALARKRSSRLRVAHRPGLVRGDIRTLPFPDAQFGLVAAPYGILQSLITERDLAAALKSVARVLAPGGRFATELVADLPSWREYRGQTRLRGWRQGKKAHVTLVESVEQQPARGLTLFHQDFIEKRGQAVRRRRFALAFRTISLPQMARRFEKAGLGVTARLGSYDGAPWTREAETWLLIAEKRSVGL
jgi:ubiquinone/menaquinone biosynthesis C-methylase UbiE